MKTNNQGRYSAKARRVSTPRATVMPRSSAAPGAAAPRQGSAPRLAARRSAYTRAEAARPATVQPASAYPRHTRSTQTSAVAGSAPLKAVLAAFAGVALLAGLAYGYFTFWRSVPVTVNGEEVRARIHSSVEDVLKGNNYFDVKLGRLLSVGGNVLKEDGGERCSVTLGEGERAAPLEPSKFAETEVAEGDVLAVSDGVDVTEPYVEAAEPIAPGLQMEAGGDPVRQAVGPCRQTGRLDGRAVRRGGGQGLHRGALGPHHRLQERPTQRVEEVHGPHVRRRPEPVHAGHPRHPRAKGR